MCVCSRVSCSSDNSHESKVLEHAFGRTSIGGMGDEDGASGNEREREREMAPGHLHKQDVALRISIESFILWGHNSICAMSLKIKSLSIDWK